METKLIDSSINLVESLFVNRTDTYALQQAEGSYHRISGSLTRQALRYHLLGQITIGAYQLNEEDNVKWLCLDLDDHCKEQLKIDEISPDSPHAVTVSLLIRKFDRYEIPLAVEFSGRRGFHLWAFLAEETPANIIRAISLGILDEIIEDIPESITVEVFPKQDRLPSPASFGSLVKLPLGVHRATGQRSYFCQPENLKSFCDKNGKLLKAQVEYLESIEKVSPENIRQLAEEIKPIGESCRLKDNDKPDTSGFAYVNDPVSAVYYNCEKIRLIKIKAEKTGKLSHEERRNLASVLAHLPGGEQEIHEVMKRCTGYNGKGNYNPRITQKQIDNIKQNLRPVTCGRLCGCRNIKIRGKGGSPIAFAFIKNQSAQLILGQ